MAILNNNPLVGSGGQQGYSINNSLRFRASASAFLNRTFGSTYTDKTKSTVSFWVKRGSLNVTNGHSIMWYNASGASGHITFAGAGAGGSLVNDCLYIGNRNATTGSGDYGLQTTQLFRDPSAWYHIMVVYDTGQATSSNRIKIYVNGTQVTAFVSAAYPSQNYQTTAFLGGNSAAHIIGYGATTGATEYFDGYLADFNFIDGQALTPSSFGETDTTTGVWKPKAYTGTYGTNGFYLKFSDIATTSGSNAGLGKDFSGNSNYWTTNNISVTAGTTYDAMTDSPTNTSATVANYCVLNPLVQRWAVNAGVFSEANLKVTTTGSSSSFGFGTIFNSTGKWYWEATLTAAGTATPGTGVGDLQCQSGTFTNLIEYNKDGSRTGGSAWASYTTNDVIGVALDCDGGNIYFYKNNTLQGSVALTAGVSYAPLMDVVLNATWAANFGQRPFSYTPPTGYVRLNTFNLPTPTILQGNKYMDATLYTGNNTGQTITNAGSFRPDFLWIKVRSNTYSHTLADSVRGVSAYLNTDLTAAEGTNSELTSFNSNGFTLGATGSQARNVSGQTYVAWQWQAGQGTNTTNTAGSITSTVSVNTTAGFSIVTYTGTGANATVGHGLGVAPKMVIVKWRSAVGSWIVWFNGFTASEYLLLNATDAKGTISNYWNGTPTSSVINLSSQAGINSNGGTYVAYCWAEIAGFSKFGSYTGNGSTDGPFVYTGFRPKFMMMKRTDSTSDWYMVDSSRATYNQIGPGLNPNTSSAEFTLGSPTGGALDFLSNGFKWRGTYIDMNANGGTYIYMAFAENPFKNSLAR